MLQGGTAAQPKAMRIVSCKTYCNNNLWKHALGAPWATGVIFFSSEQNSGDVAKGTMIGHRYSRPHHNSFSPYLRLYSQRGHGLTNVGLACHVSTSAEARVLTA